MSDVDPKLVERARTELSRGIITLVMDEPFFGHLLGGLNRDISARTQTAGVSLRGGHPLITVNPEFFVKTITRKAERVAVIKHEALHLIFDHVSRMGASTAGSGFTTMSNRYIFNLAADVVVNQFIGRKWPLPDGAVTLDSFDFALPPDESVEWYYKKLKTELKSGSAPGGSGSTDTDGTGDDSDSESGQPGQFGMPTSSHSDHSGWGIESDDVDTHIARHELGRLLRDAKDRSGSRYYTTVPGPIQSLVDVFLAELEPTVDWRRVLRMFSNSSRRTRIANTLRRPSKRYGTYPGVKVKRHHRIAVLIDTSGSVSDDLLSEFFAEVNGIWRQGSEVTIVEADAAVQRVWEYGGKGLPSSVSGRGGTAFNPALQFVADAKRPYDAAVYLTDGFASPPTVKPGCKVLWVLSEDGSANALTGHRTVKINR